MRGARVAMGASLGTLVLGCVALVQAQDVQVTNADRLWENFKRETAVVDSGQIRVEVQGMTLNATREAVGPQVLSRGTPAGPPTAVLNNVNNVAGGVLSLIGSYGLLPNTEVG